MILVTGPTGFLGRRVIKALAQAGHTVRALVHTPRHATTIDGLGVDIAYGDVLDPPSLDAATRGTQVVVHLVAIIREFGERTFQSVNHHGTANVVEAARKAGVSCFVHMSSIGSRADDRFPYLHSKWQSEQVVAQQQIPYTILRGSILFGEGDEFFNSLASVIKASPLSPVAGTGKSRFQPLSVDDAAECVVRVVQNATTHENRLIEIGGPQQFTYDELMDLVQKTLRTWRPRIHIPLPFMRAALGVLGTFVPNPPATDSMMDMLNIDNVTEPNAVEKIFGFTPRSVQGGIDYICRLTYWDAVKIATGFMPAHVRDH